MFQSFLRKGQRQQDGSAGRGGNASAAGKTRRGIPRQLTQRLEKWMAARCHPREVGGPRAALSPARGGHGAEAWAAPRGQLPVGACSRGALSTPKSDSPGRRPPPPATTRGRAPARQLVKRGALGAPVPESDRETCRHWVSGFGRENGSAPRWFFRLYDSEEAGSPRRG